MQVGNLGLYPKVTNLDLDRIKSPTESQNQVRNIFNNLPANTNSDLTSAFQNVSLTNVQYASELSAFDIQRAAVDNLTGSYNNKLADLSSSEMDHATASFNTQQVAQSVQSINSAITNTKAIIGNYLNQISGSHSNINAINSSIRDIDKDLLVSESVVNNHKHHSKRMKSLETDYSSAFLAKNSLMNNLNSISTSMSNIDTQIAALNTPNATGLIPNESAINQLIQQRQELEEKYAQITKELDKNDEIINQYDDSKTIVNSNDDKTIANLETKIADLHNKRQELIAQKRSEQSTLRDYRDKKNAANGELGAAHGLLNSLIIRQEIAENNEARALTKVHNRQEELKLIHGSLDNSFSVYQSKQTNVEKAEHKFNDSTEFLNLVTQKHKLDNK
ncbi:MAG: hypothetical protein A2287_00680 [Candidatus Melainabacteria bacterium RIFOXYA12_FULL_32_12]|nr:MAG: hypothetical protein A2255_10585 [Candidatus Melainabacteria bacterium RIFOXYA2_FULL_32_9]OGI29154.1 MAG: hypothetical protein A2287_00680 [Candidatus Melainabacteria bacterium RIFOXYA12_FULL_32_12]